MEDHQMDWANISSYYDHWQDGDESIKQELLRVAQLSLAGGIANAKLVLGDMATKFKAAMVSPQIYLNKIDEVLQTHIEIMEAKSNRNPFMLLNEKPQMINLAQRFATAYLTGTSPHNALSWLQELDRLDERVQFLVDGVCQAIVRLKLIELRENALALVHKEKIALQTELPKPSFLPLERSQDSSAETDASVDVNLTQGIEDDTKSKDQIKDLANKEYIKEGTREDLKQKLHGFPWDKGPASSAVAKIHGFLKDQKIIHDLETPTSVISSLFSETGPAAPIRLLKGPGKLIHMLRWLSMQNVINFEDEFGLVDYSEAELRNYGLWLYPRFIGTFRNVSGQKFTSRQLKNAASRLKYEQLLREKWYIDMVAMLERSRNTYKSQ
jgi:hypothetical protein